MAFVYVRDSDSIVVNVNEDQQSPISGISEYEVDWSETDLNWIKYKITRGSDGSFTNAGELQPEYRIQKRLGWQEAGKRVMAIISDRNVQKGLTETQILTMIATYQVVCMTLLVGSIDIARNRVNAITPDGTLITSDDKIYILALLDDYLAQED